MPGSSVKNRTINNRNGKTDATRPAIRSAIYTRKSTSENLDSSFNSLDAQREACELYIQSQASQGWIVLPDKYDDAAYSGATMVRPSIQQLLADVESGKIDIVVVYKIDRLSRNLLEFNQTLNFFEQHNASFVSVTEHFNTQTPMGRFAMNMISSISQMEREVIAERIRDKVAASKRRGMYMGGVPPLGYDVDRKRKQLVVNDKEAVLVRNIFVRYLELHSVTAVMKELNKKKLTTKSWMTKKGVFRKGHAWNKAHIYRLLDNPVYIGKVKHRDKVYQGEHEAIIEKSLWDEVQKMLKRNSKTSFRSPTPALLKGLIRCGHCNTSMGVTSTKKRGRTYRYYLCLHAKQSGYDTCPVKTVPAGDVENAVLTQVRRALQTPEVMANIFLRAVQMEKEEHQSLTNHLADLDGEIKPLKDAVKRARHVESVENFESNSHSNIEHKLEALLGKRQQIADELVWREDHPVTEADLTTELTRFDGIWDELFPAERVRIMRLLVESVTITQEGIDLELRANGLGSLVAEIGGQASYNLH